MMNKKEYIKKLEYYLIEIKNNNFIYNENSYGEIRNTVTNKLGHIADRLTGIEELLKYAIHLWILKELKNEN